MSNNPAQRNGLFIKQIENKNAASSSPEVTVQAFAKHWVTPHTSLVISLPESLGESLIVGKGVGAVGFRRAEKASVEQWLREPLLIS